MLANFLEKSKPINFIVYLSGFFCFFLIALITNFFEAGVTWLKVLESLGLFGVYLVVFFFYNFIVSKNNLTFDHSYAFFIFTLTTILFTSYLFDFEILLLFIVYLLYLRKIYSLRSSKNIIQKLFDSGFWLGILYILEPCSIVFFLVTLSSITLYQKLSIQYLMTPIIGFLTPIIIYYTYLFWTTNSIQVLPSLHFDFNMVASNYFKNTINWYTLVLLFCTLIAIILKTPKIIAINNSFKRSWQLLIINLLVSLIYMALVLNNNNYEVLLLTVPASVIIANGCEEIHKKIIKNIIFSLMLIATVIGFFTYNFIP